MLTDYRRDMSCHLTKLGASFQKLYQRSVLARGVQRYHSYFNRSYLPPTIGEDKIWHYAETAPNLSKRRRTESTLASGHVTRYSNLKCQTASHRNTQFPRKLSNSQDLFQGLTRTQKQNQAYQLKAGSS
ncbi:hypothetical protein F511_16752 [Dorcoceras hygrometricum]|uniref:Uncharacterized protein n=1 Tax=Dorcoceras hygrometricum TaxID=472368 RepID=A0A2Z7AMG8_9LAMI|nr:hypothetical protein F511_16752 [Dorcoceras hygrometricum]